MLVREAKAPEEDPHAQPRGREAGTKHRNSRGKAGPAFSYSLVVSTLSKGGALSQRGTRTDALCRKEGRAHNRDAGATPARPAWVPAQTLR